MTRIFFQWNGRIEVLESGKFRRIIPFYMNNTWNIFINILSEQKVQPAFHRPFPCNPENLFM